MNGNRLSERLRESIEEEIATGKLLPGTRLDEVDLATRFGVSRTPIREALRLLLGEGLVETRPQRLMKMFGVMAEREGMCARLAARRLSDTEMAEIEAAHDACRGSAAARDADAYFYANERFHYAIYAASHNTFLFEQAASLQRKLRPYRRLQLRVRNRPQRWFGEHQATLDALREGDADKAQKSIRSHVVVQGERFADLVASLGQMTGSAAPTDTPAEPAASV